jgi:hypothetical protein
MGSDTILMIFLFFLALNHAYYRHCRDKVEDAQFRAVVRLLQKIAGDTDDSYDEKWYREKRFWE